MAGSQVSFAALLFVPVGGLILADGLRQVSEWQSARHAGHPGRGGLVALITTAVVAALAFQALVQPAILRVGDYRGMKPLPFAGADLVRQPAAQTDALARIVNGLKARCDTFVSQPGLNSFYFWAGMAPPGRLNLGDWMFLLNDRQQQDVVDAIRPVRRLCQLRNDDALAVWTGENRNPGEGRPLPDRPLLRYLDRGFEPLDAAQGYQLSIRGNRLSRP